MRTISYDDYLRLVGLLTLATDHRKQIEAIERSACAITGEVAAAGGHTGDEIWAGQHGSAQRLLEVLGIRVEEVAPTGDEALRVLAEILSTDDVGMDSDCVCAYCHAVLTESPHSPTCPIVVGRQLLAVTTPPTKSA